MLFGGLVPCRMCKAKCKVKDMEVQEIFLLTSWYLEQRRYIGIHFDLNKRLALQNINSLIPLAECV